MRLDEAGLNLIRTFESYSTVAYKDEAGKWTIGFGHTRDVREGDSCTTEEAESYLECDVEEAEGCVNRNVNIQLSQNEFNALVSFVFNEGARHFLESTLLKKLLSGDRLGAAKEFLKWVYITDPDTSEKTISEGLMRRRHVESFVFSSEMLAKKSVA
jgi:lysozyme